MLKQQFQTSLTDSFAIFTGVGQPQYDNLGDLRFEAGGAGMACYKFIKASGTTTSAIGDFLCYTDNTVQIADGAQAVAFGGAGVAQFAIAAGTPLVGWVQITGKATFNTNFGATAPTAGDCITHVGAAAKTCQGLTAAAAPLQGIVGRAINTTNLAMLDLPLG